MVQEFKVQTSPYDPQYGYFSNGQVNVATRAGTNEFRGNVFEFLRNDVLDARNFFDFDEPLRMISRRARSRASDSSTR
jgi:hypothetical protein